MSTLETIKNKIAEINAKKQELVADLRKDFAPMLKPLFDKSKGKIKSFGWSQYTPYFNDGDECIFRINIDYPYINDFNEDDDEYDLFTVSTWGLRKIAESEQAYKDWIAKYPEDSIDVSKFGDELELFKLIEDFKQKISSIDNEFLKDLFGDHVLVTVHEDGRIETEEYEHD